MDKVGKTFLVPYQYFPGDILIINIDLTIFIIKSITGNCLN